MFPDPTRSPARYTRELSIRWVEAIRPEDAQEGGLLWTFSRVVWLELDATSTPINNHTTSPFHAFSPSVKSLRVTGFTLVRPQVFHLILSLPLLENLCLDDYDSIEWYEPPIISSSTSPTLTGTLELTVCEGLETITPQLLDLPNGLHFRKQIFWCHYYDDLPWVEELMAACSNTLKCLDVGHNLPSTILFW